MERAMEDNESTASSQRNTNAVAPFGRDFTSSVHVYFTHWMWARNLGFQIHPSIPITGDLAVAAVNDATGIWSIELAREHPTWRCDSFNFSGDQFPPANWMPKNVSLSVLDLTKPIPLELRGQYDIVRCPFISLHSRKGDYMQIVDHILQFLKPGGYFQWEEGDILSVRAVSSRPEVPTDDMATLGRIMTGGLQHLTGSDCSWISRLDELAHSRRQNVLAMTRHPCPDDIAAPWTLQHLMAAMGMIQSLEDDSETAGQWLDAYDRAALAVVHGVSMRMDLVCCLSQMPMQRGQSDASRRR